MHLHSVAPSNLLGEALQYLHGQWPKLAWFLGNGARPLDSNPVQNTIRPSSAEDARGCSPAPSTARTPVPIFYSLIETAKANNVEPYQYLVALFKTLPLAQTADDREPLLPRNIELGGL